MKKLIMFTYNLIMGKHPYNTIFSYNYHNIRGIISFYKKFVDEYRDSEKKIIIDVGGGRSPYFKIFQDISKEFYVVDFKSALPEEENRNIIQIDGVAEELNLNSEYADIIMSNQVLEHVIDENTAVKEAYRVLKKGGIFTGSVPHISPIHLEPYDFRRFTRYGIIKLLEENGFSNIKIESSGGIYKTAAFLVLMDWFLNKDKGKGQKFNIVKHFLFAPLTFFINLTSLIADKIFTNKERSPSNYCWTAVK